MASEEECRKLREKALEVRRKLDDTQGALQELGRENQTLQVSQNVTFDFHVVLSQGYYTIRMLYTI